MNTPHAYRSHQYFQVTKNLALGLGGVRYHRALLQGDSYNLFVGSHRNELQVIVEGRVVSSITVSARSLTRAREICWSFAGKSKNWTFAYPECERNFQLTKGQWFAYPECERNFQLTKGQ